MTTTARPVRLVGITLACAGLAACSAIGIEPNTFESGALPAITSTGAGEVLAGLDEALDEANAARDPGALASVVAEPLLGIEAARYGLDATADPDDAEPLPPVEHLDPTVFIPQFEGYPQWFVAAAALAEDAPVRIEVLHRESSAAPWFLSISTDLQVGVEFPVLALDDAGYVVPLSEDDLEAMPVGIEDLAAEHAALLGGGEATGVAGTLADDAWTAARVAADAARVTGVAEAAVVTATYAAGTALPQALRTEDGGTLVFYTLTEEVAYVVQPNFFLELDPPTAALVGADQVTTGLEEQWAAQLAVYVPADDDGVARVVGARFDRVGLSGS